MSKISVKPAKPKKNFSSKLEMTEDGDKYKHDYRMLQTECDGFEMIVRPSHKYGSACAGEHVLVDEREVRVPSTAAALMSPEEAIDLEQVRETKKLAAEAKLTGKGSLSHTISEGLKRLLDKDPVTRAKTKSTNDILDADKEARRAHLLRELEALE